MPTDDATPTTDEVPTRSGLRARLANRRRWQERNRQERGIVVIWVALMLVVLIGMCGFAVDLSNWWLQSERIQRAADAGAHAGVVFLPGDLQGATTTARAETAKNGYRATGGSQNATVAVAQEPNPNRLRVRVTTEVPTYFVKVFGINSIDLTREAVAEYVAPVPMGSPENKLGNDPARGQNSPQFWINVAGPKSSKRSGDRYQAKNCSASSNGGHAPAGCTAVNGTNTEYAENGYFFALDVKNRPAGQPLQVQVYDPAFVYNGDKCENSGNSPVPVVWPTAGELATLQGTYGTDAAQRYAGGLTRWCTGDQNIEGNTNKTTFIVREPDDTPWSDVDNPVVSGCTTTMPAFNPRRTDGSGGSKTIFQYLNPAGGNPDAVVDGVAPWTFAEVYRRNVTICSIPAASVKTGAYILQVRTNALAASPLTYTSTVADGGHNRMSIFAGFGATGLASTDGSNVTINARGRLPIYANADAANTTFYLARILPYDAGRTLRITLYDIGDASQAGTLQILPPTEFATTFSGCAFSRNDGASLSTTASTCTLNNVSSGNGYDARSVNVDVPIPDNYTCNSAQPTGCWVKVRAAFPAGVSDTTTWSAAILGNPIRLVE